MASFPCGAHGSLDEELQRILDFASAEIGGRVRFIPLARAHDSPYTLGVAVRGTVEHGVLCVGETSTLEPHAARFLAAISRLVADRLDRQRERAEAVRLRAESVRRLLEADALSMDFQPIYDLRSGEVVGVEALSRFTDERSPDWWFAEAADVGLSLELEARVIATAAQAFTVLPSDVYVNVTPAVAALPQLRRHLQGLPVDRLVFEITEHNEVADYGQLMQALRPLRRRGLRLAVDDAGAGFASLRHILRIHPDIVKLDMSLVRNIDRDPVLRALAYSITAFGSAVEARVIAEGIETRGELHAVRFLGIELGQGFLLQRPVTLEELALRGDALSRTTTV